MAPQALAQGWLDLKVASTKLCRKPFQSGKRRYCALKQHGVPYVLFYYISDGSSQPNGFIKFDNPKVPSAGAWLCAPCRPSPVYSGAVLLVRMSIWCAIFIMIIC